MFLLHRETERNAIRFGSEQIAGNLKIDNEISTLWLMENQAKDSLQ
jgi:hypothetical protein